MSTGDDVVASLVYGGFAVTFMSILLFAFVRYCKVRALYSPMDYAMGFSISGCGWGDLGFGAENPDFR